MEAKLAAKEHTATPPPPPPPQTVQALELEDHRLKETTYFPTGPDFSNQDEEMFGISMDNPDEILTAMLPPNSLEGRVSDPFLDGNDVLRLHGCALMGDEGSSSSSSDSSWILDDVISSG